MNTTKSATIQMFQKENLSVFVEEYIKDKILRGYYKGGERILEADIAGELGISRGPVREAIKAAERTGILTVEARKGAYVTIIDEQDFQEVFEIRVLLENSILEDLIANQKLTAKDFVTLNGIVHKMVELTHSNLLPLDKHEIILSLNKHDIEFHQFLWAKSGSIRKEKILSDIFFQLRLAMIYDTKITDNLTVTATEHYKIINYLRDGDLENSKQALKDHIVTYYSRG